MMTDSLNFDPHMDYYAQLGVKPDASDDEIKRAYRKLAKQNHPDRTGGDKAKERRFKEVTNAYEVLSNHKRKTQYDAYRTEGPRINASHLDLGDLFGMFSGGGPGMRGGTTMGGNPFEAMFDGPPRGRPRPQRPAPPVEKKVRARDGSLLTQRGHDVHSEVHLTIDQAVLGTAKQVSTLAGKATVKIPPGTSSGKRLRLRHKGVPTPNGERGDHYVTVQIDVPPAGKLTDAAKRALAEFMKQIGS